MDADPDRETKYPFTPIEVAREDHSAQLAQEIENMERSRGWFDAQGQKGIKHLLTGKRSEIGDNNSTVIEGLLNVGGVRIVELGAGDLSASKQLANLGPNKNENTIVAVEPFLEDKVLENVPVNLRTVGKKVEDLTEEDISSNSIDAAFSAGHVFNYPEDKLAFLQQVWRILKPEATASIEYIGQPIVPPLVDIFTRIGLSETITIGETGKETYVIRIKKLPGKTLDFGDYTYRSEPSHYFKADLRTIYEFQ